MTDIDPNTNVTPFQPKDPTAAERKRRSRAKQRKRRVTPVTIVPVTAPVTLPTMAGQGGVAQRIDEAPQSGRSIAVRNAARDAASVTAAENSYLARLVTLEPVNALPPHSPQAAPPPPPQAMPGRIAVFYSSALALAGVSAWYSIIGMTSIFVGSFWPVIATGIALELGKLSAVAALPTLQWGPLKAALIVLVAVLMGLNAVGCYGFLAKAHVEHAVAGDVTAAGRFADIDARLAVQTALVSDLDRRIAQIDAAVEKATSKGRTAAAMALAGDQRRTRSDLVAQRTTEARTLAGLKVERAKADGERQLVEADLGPVRYLETLLGAGDQDVLRYFILVVAMLLDPAAVLLLLAATSARRSIAARALQPHASLEDLRGLVQRVLPVQ
jgi:hypothetical protein